MTRARCFALAALIGACWMGPARVNAQSGPYDAGFGPSNGPPQMGAAAPSGFPNPYAFPGGAYPPGGGYAQPAGYSADYSNAGLDGSYGPPPTQLADPQWAANPGGYEEGPLPFPEAGRRPIIEQSYMRLEYLNWTISRPGDIAMGAPVANVPDVTVPQNLFDQNGAFLGTAQVASTSQMTFNKINGFRGTIGVDLVTGGSLEATGFIMKNATSAVTYDRLFNTQTYIATSTLVDNLVWNQANLQLYNTSFRANASSAIWGAEFNYLIEGERQGLFQFRPLFGARYLSVREKLNQEGIYTDTTLYSPPLVTDIDSATINNFFGGQAGFRLEAVTKYVTLGAEPKFAVMGNAGSASVSSFHFRSILDPLVTSQQNFGVASALIEAGTYARIHPTPNMTFSIGYNFMFLTRVSRPATNIVYNDNGPLVPPDIHVQRTFSDITIQGLTLGAEFRY